MKNRFRLLLLVTGLLLPSLAQAGFYARPRAGAAIPIHGGDSSYSLGATAGYQWTDFLATQLSYSRLIGTGSTPSGDLVQAEGILSFPFVPVVTPFVSAGVGASHVSDWNPMFLVGGGATMELLSFLQLGAGVSYAAVRNAPDFFEPYVSVGIGF